MSDIHGGIRWIDSVMEQINLHPKTTAYTGEPEVRSMKALGFYDLSERHKTVFYGKRVE